MFCEVKILWVSAGSNRRLFFAGGGLFFDYCLRVAGDMAYSLASCKWQDWRGRFFPFILEHNEIIILILFFKI